MFRNMKVCFIVCWFGKLPNYMPVWLKTCEYNKEFDFILLTDSVIDFELPQNVKYISFSKEKMLDRIKKRIEKKAKLDKPYRVCDFRPMYGIIFKEEIETYDFWGYCDIDVVFGHISKFVTLDDLNNKEAVFNGGHFTLVKNNEKMNMLFKKNGALFDYKTVAKKEAIYAFDETTGFQRIARANNINARFGIPYIETESKYTQLRSRLERMNPNHQAYFWENGSLYRVKEEGGECYYQEIAYIHLQKREISILDETVVSECAFWIVPRGFVSKKKKGLPDQEEINIVNPDMGEKIRVKEEKDYKRAKLFEILKRNPFQIYVRLCQQFAGINAGDGKQEELKWIKY